MAQMAVCTCQFSGEALGKRSSLEVFVPQQAGPFGVLYLLHGLSDDCTCWGRLTPLLRLAREVRMMVVCPDGARGFYTNDPRPGGYAYEDHIVKDVIGFVDATFPTIPHGRARAVAGLSMGGYGAMMLALKHPQLFSAASSHSSAFYVATERMAGRNAYAEWLAGSEVAAEYDVFALAERAAGGPLAALRFDCGTEDSLLESNRAFHEHLAGLGVAHDYAEFPGGHNWEYWDEHVRTTLAFAAEHLAKE